MEWTNATVTLRTGAVTHRINISNTKPYNDASVEWHVPWIGKYQHTHITNICTCKSEICPYIFTHSKTYWHSILGQS